MATYQIILPYTPSLIKKLIAVKKTLLENIFLDKDVNDILCENSEIPKCLKEKYKIKD